MITFFFDVIKLSRASIDRLIKIQNWIEKNVLTAQHNIESIYFYELILNTDFRCSSFSPVSFK